ncbi:MAG: preprotein translocase subunit SecE [Robiginitomaculum sp.]|nr:preprotein translocase subunit SecE [Robiginitomaculum sp.]
MAEKTKPKVGPVKYLAQVRQEGRKVVWPSMRETVTTTIMVIIVMIIFGIFFFFVDWAAANGTTAILKIGT